MPTASETTGGRVLTLKDARRRLWEMIEIPQGAASIGDEDYDVSTWEELEELCMSGARNFQTCVNICHAVARTARANKRCALPATGETGERVNEVAGGGAEK